MKLEDMGERGECEGKERTLTKGGRGERRNRESGGDGKDNKGGGQGRTGKGLSNQDG